MSAKLRENWANAWRVGRFEFEVEWVPRAHTYSLTFSVLPPRGAQAQPSTAPSPADTGEKP